MPPGYDAVGTLCRANRPVVPQGSVESLCVDRNHVLGVRIRHRMDWASLPSLYCHPVWRRHHKVATGEAVGRLDRSRPPLISWTLGDNVYTAIQRMSKLTWGETAISSRAGTPSCSPNIQSGSSGSHLFTHFVQRCPHAIKEESLDKNWTNMAANLVTPL